MTPEILALLETIQIEKDPFVKARLLHQITKEQNVRVKDLALALKKTPSFLCNLMRIVRLPDIVVDGFYSHNVTLTHLLVLSRLKEHTDIVSVYELILQNSLSVQRVEELVRNKLYGISSDGNRLSDETIKKISGVFKKLDSDVIVHVVQTRIKAKVTIEVKGNLSKTSQVLTKFADSKLIK